MAPYYECDLTRPLPDGVSFREMTLADVPAGLALCRASGWNQVGRDWERFLSASPRGTAVAVSNGRVVGSVATLPYDDRFAWISMVLVNPAERGRGIGTALLERGLALVPPGMTPRLDATPAGESVYRPLGFVGEYTLSRWQLDTRRQRPAAHPDVRGLDSRDWPAMLDLDAPAFGARRESQLRWLASGAAAYAWVHAADGVITGFLLGRYGHRRDQLGPLVARNRASAEALVSTCLAAHPDRSFYLDTPDRHVEWAGWLSGLGFTIERPFLRMHRGPLADAGRPDIVFAITGPEFG
jgi:GNAT superfamily N-acetyltransferase